MRVRNKRAFTTNPPMYTRIRRLHQNHFIFYAVQAISTLFFSSQCTKVISTSANPSNGVSHDCKTAPSSECLFLSAYNSFPDVNDMVFFTFCLLISLVMNIKYLFCVVFQVASGKRNTCVRVHKCASVCVCVCTICACVAALH